MLRLRWVGGTTKIRLSLTQAHVKFVGLSWAHVTLVTPNPLLPDVFNLYDATVAIPYTYKYIPTYIHTYIYIYI